MNTTNFPCTLIFAGMLLAASLAGCNKPPDERLADFAQRTMLEQSLQNQRMADQSEAIVAESQQLAEAAKELVTSDATARRELIAAQQDLTSQLNQRQSTVDAGQEQLEQERREIAQQRHRDPIIAAVIQNFGLVIACLLPLLVAVQVIRQMRSQEPDEAAVAELLLLELTSDRPRLLPGPHSRVPGLVRSRDETQLRAVTNHSASPANTTSSTKSTSSTNAEVELPF